MREVFEGAIAGEDTPAQVVESRRRQVVSDNGALIAKLDAALAAQPDALEKIREGKVQAGRAAIGAVATSMGGESDAARQGYRAGAVSGLAPALNERARRSTYTADSAELVNETSLISSAAHIELR